MNRRGKTINLEHRVQLSLATQSNIILLHIVLSCAKQMASAVLDERVCSPCTYIYDSYLLRDASPW